MSNLSSSLTVILKDDVTKPARSAAQAMDEVRNKAKQVAQQMGSVQGPEKLVRSLQKLGLEKRDIEAVARAWQSYAQNMKLAASSGDWTRTQAAAVREWESQTIRALREVKRERAAFDRAMRKPAVPPKPAHNEYLAGHASIAKTIGAGAVGHGMLHATKETVEHAAEAEQLRFRIRELSRKDPSEAKLADSLALEIAAKYPAVSINKALDNYIELRANSVGADGKVDPVIARRNAFAAARAQNAAQAIGEPMTPQDMQNLLKGVEGSGRAEDPKAVEKITDAYIRAKQVFGSAIASSMVRDYVANAKSSNFSIGDDQFYLANMVRMSEGNASRLGNEVNQTLSTIAGGSMKKASGKWLVELGLAKQEDMESTGGGNVRFKHGVKDHDLLETNQGKWAATTLKEAIEHHGVVSEDKVEARMKMLREQDLKSNPNAEIDEHFLRKRAEEGLIAAYLAKAGFRTTVSDNLAHLIGNERLIDRDTLAMKNASGLEAGDRISENPMATFKELSSAISSFATTVGSPAVQAVSGYMHSLATSIGSFTAALGEWAGKDENKKWATAGSIGAIGVGVAGGGALMYGALGGLMNGFGLKTSAVALDGSAAALTRAAAVLGAGGKLPGALPGGELPGGKPPGSKPSSGSRAGKLLWGGLTAWNLWNVGSQAYDDIVNGTPESRIAKMKENWEASDKLNKGAGNWANQYLPNWFQFDENGNSPGLLSKLFGSGSTPAAEPHQNTVDARQKAAELRARDPALAFIRKREEEARGKTIAGVPVTGWMPPGYSAGPANNSGGGSSTDGTSAKAPGQDTAALNRTVSPQVDASGGVPPNGWVSPSKAAPDNAVNGTASPLVDSSGFDALISKGQQAGQNIAALNATVSPQVDSSGLDILILKGQQAKALLESLGSLAAQSGSINVPSFNRNLRGNFSTGGGQGS